MQSFADEQDSVCSHCYFLCERCSRYRNLSSRQRGFNSKRACGICYFFLIILKSVVSRIKIADRSIDEIWAALPDDTLRSDIERTVPLIIFEGTDVRPIELKNPRELELRQ